MKEAASTYMAKARQALDRGGEARKDIVMEKTCVLGWTGSNSILLSTSRKFWSFETEIQRNGEPWVKYHARGAFSVNEKDYYMTQSDIFAPDWGLVHSGKTIIDVKKRTIFGSLYDFDCGGKRWTIDNKMGSSLMGASSRKVMIECGGQAAGEIKKAKVLSWTASFEAWLSNDLPDEIQVMLIWIANKLYDRAISAKNSPL